MKIIFFGSDDFAAENLSRLLGQGFSVAACVTQPDRPSGRGLQVVLSPIKVIAQQHRIPVLQPQDLKDRAFIDYLRAYQADLFIVIAYGKILPEDVLNIPKLFCVNVHGSLLPKYRGAAPINWAIINGERETGFTLIKMNNKMDAGQIIVQEKMTIADEETSQELRVRMAKQSAECLCQTVRNIETGKFSLTQQNEKDVTLAPKLTKELGQIDWHKSAEEIHNLVRGLLPWPGAFTLYKGKIIKILKIGSTPIYSQKRGADPIFPGTIVSIDKKGIGVATGKGCLLLEKVQPESGKAMPAHSFAVGYKLQPGDSLGQ